MKIKSSILPLKPYQPGKSIEQVQKEHKLSKIIKLASNENVYGPSPSAKKCLQQFGEDFHYYPDGYAEKLRLKLADKLNVDKDELIFGSGSEEIIQMICRAYLEKGTNTVMANPTFPQYKHYATIEGADLREVSLINGKHDLTSMLNQINENTRVVWLCTPNNPTGSFITKDELLRFIHHCPKHVLIVLDEAYYEYVVSTSYPETVSLLQKHQNIIILRTFSKAYGLAGLRIGYGIANREIIIELNKIRGPFNVTSIAQYAAVHAIEDNEYIENIKMENQRVRKKLEDFCLKNDLTFDDSETNFLLIHLPISGLVVSEKLLACGFIVRPGELLGVPNSIRVTIGTEIDMQHFEEALKSSL